MGEQKISVYEFGSFRLEVAERRLVRGGQPVHLTCKVFDLLTLLVQCSGHLISKDELMREVWPDSLVEENNLTVSMSTLRKALGEEGTEQRYIETVHKSGYRFIAEVREINGEK
jgi:DNA-binding winged helix-turn-helix (wHTH) protein